MLSYITVHGGCAILSVGTLERRTLHGDVRLAGHLSGGGATFLNIVGFNTFSDFGKPTIGFKENRTHMKLVDDRNSFFEDADEVRFLKLSMQFVMCVVDYVNSTGLSIIFCYVC